MPLIKQADGLEDLDVLISSFRENFFIVVAIKGIWLSRKQGKTSRIVLESMSYKSRVKDLECFITLFNGVAPNLLNCQILSILIVSMLAASWSLKKLYITVMFLRCRERKGNQWSTQTCSYLLGWEQ